MEAEDDEEVSDRKDKSQEFKTTWSWSRDGEGGEDEAENEEVNDKSDKINKADKIVWHCEYVYDSRWKDEGGGGDEQILQINRLQQHAISETSYNR